MRQSGSFAHATSNEPPTNCWDFATRESANSYAKALHELTGPMMTKIVGAPALLKLAEDFDEIREKIKARRGRSPGATIEALREAMIWGNHTALPAVCLFLP